MSKTPLITEIVKSLQPKDPVQEAIDSLDMHGLDDDQMDTLVDYMKEMIASSTSRGSQTSPAEAAGMALEDVAGFEGAPPKVMRDTVNRLVQAYTKKFGA